MSYFLKLRDGSTLELDSATLEPYSEIQEVIAKSNLQISGMINMELFDSEKMKLLFSGVELDDLEDDELDDMIELASQLGNLELSERMVRYKNGVEEPQTMNNIPIELIYDVMYKLNYSDILRYCSTNKRIHSICKTPYFWERKTGMEFDVTKRINRLLPNETQKERYLRLVTRKGEYYPGSERYLSFERIGEKILEISSLDREYFYARFDEYDLSNAFMWLANAEKGKTGSIGKTASIVSLFSRKDYATALIKASKRGYIDIVKILIAYSALTDNFTLRNYENAMVAAAKGGHIDIVKLMLKKGATNYEETLSTAAKNGHMDIVKLLIDRGIAEGVEYDYDLILTKAAYSGNKDIVELLLGLGADDYSGAMKNAAREGHKNIVEMMLALGATNYDDTLLYASTGGHLDIVEMMLALGATEYNSALTVAIDEGNLSIEGIKLLVNKGGEIDIAMLSTAAMNGNIELIEYILDLNPDDGSDEWEETIEEAKEEAELSGYLEIWRLLDRFILEALAKREI